MKFFENRFLKSLLKFSKFLHEYRFEAFSEHKSFLLLHDIDIQEMNVFSIRLDDEQIIV
ncbi:hypothetical protein IGM_06634 [Bacillus cereus HuB4-4]|uniref:Uncharacterized protein n=1 Tax=Bacillus cereus HuB4-4 TaxID=1053211 RepID=A0A9W5VI67_BACCE|nr:hypothetical protein [Bacillus cereus]EOP78683.1 hypothetical protein IGM_06634 [Bacillus cereus HuB4-4]